MEAATEGASRPKRHGGRPPVTAAARLTRVRALILGAAAISFVFSVSLWFNGNTDAGLFVGIWVPSIISLGGFLVPRKAE